MLEVEQYHRTSPKSPAPPRARSLPAPRRDPRRRTRRRRHAPHVRALAKRLGKSPATVNSAYRILRQRGLATADGRRGTRVAPRPALRAPAAARRQSHPQPPAPGQPERRDLAAGLADPALLPPIGPAIARSDFDARLRASGSEAVDARMLEAATRSFAADGIADRRGHGRVRRAGRARARPPGAPAPGRPRRGRGSRAIRRSATSCSRWGWWRYRSRSTTAG